MKRVIAHWTGGGYTANAIDRKAYHFLVQGDGSVVRGTHSVADNVSTADGKYAAHTKGCNTGSIGVTMCAMSNCQEKPFKTGPAPLKERQWDVMTEVVAELCRFYDIPVRRETVLGHGEVQTTLGIAQNGKWDPMVLPWNRSLAKADVGNLLRAHVKRHLDGPPELPERPVRVVAEINGRPASAFIFNGSLFMRPLDVPSPSRAASSRAAAADGDASLAAAASRTVEMDGERVVEVDLATLGIDVLIADE